MSDRCERCDREECNRRRLLTPEMHAVTRRILDAAGNATIEDRRAMYEWQQQRERDEADCDAHRKDWRAEAMELRERLAAFEGNPDYDDELERLRDAISEHLPTYAGDHEGENADAIDTVIAAGDELNRAQSWRAKVEPLIEAVRVEHNTDGIVSGRREAALDALHAATAKGPT